MKLYTQHKKITTIEDNPFAKGGQGGIHSIITPISNPVCVAKLYLSIKKAAEVEKRIVYMINNNPFANAQQMIADSFAWPLEALYNDLGEFVGFTMRLITDSKSLWNMTIPKGFKDEKWGKFNVTQIDSYNKRLKVLYNTCQALNVLDKSDKYRVVDLKPQNMMLTNNAHIKIIDCDSFQIAQNNQVIFNAEAATEEFCPPEFHQGKINFRKQFVPNYWDYFSFAISAYQVLFCIHPFNGSHSKYQTQAELIKNGLFVHGSRKNEFIAIPPPHKNFNFLISRSLKNLFFKAFEDGHRNPSIRPSFEVWRDALLTEIYRLNNIPTSSGTYQPTPIKQKPHYRPKKVIPKTTVKVFGGVLNSFDVNYNGYTATLNWNISNTQTVYINGKRVALKGSMVVPLLDKAYSLLIVDHNGISKTFQQKVKSPLDVSLKSVITLNKPKDLKSSVITLNYVNNIIKLHPILLNQKISGLNMINKIVRKPNLEGHSMTKTSFQKIQKSIKLNRPVSNMNILKIKPRTYASFYKVAGLTLLFISKILSYKF